MAADRRRGAASSRPQQSASSGATATPELRQAVVNAAVDAAVEEVVVDAAVEELRRQRRDAAGDLFSGLNAQTWRYFEVGSFSLFFAVLLGLLGGLPWAPPSADVDTAAVVDQALAGQAPVDAALPPFEFPGRPEPLPWGNGELLTGTVPKPGGAVGSSSREVGKSREFSVLRRSLLPLARRIRKTIDADKAGVFSMGVDEVDGQPAYEVYVISGGKQDASFAKASQVKIADRLDKDLLPWIRKKYACKECAVCTAFLRRYRPNERRLNPNHFDLEAFVTVVVALSNATEHEGGLYVQPGADARTRRLLPLDQGDALVHQYDLNHGVAVTNGTRYSLIVWISSSRLACEQGRSPWYEKQAEDGDADAQWNLGHLYKRGTRGYQRNNATAVLWYTRSAEQSHPGAMNNLALAIEEECEVAGSTDCSEADTWFRKAAETGESNAQMNLARRLVAARRFTEGARWYAKAAMQGIPKAMVVLGEVLEERPGAAPREVTSSPVTSGGRTPGRAGGRSAPALPATAEGWYARAAAWGYLPAFRSLGRLHEARGDDALSAEWHRRGADMGDGDCMIALARQHLAGKGVNASEDEAARWLQRAVALGRKDAKRVLQLLHSTSR